MNLLAPMWLDAVLGPEGAMGEGEGGQGFQGVLEGVG